MVKRLQVKYYIINSYKFTFPFNSRRKKNARGKSMRAKKMEIIGGNSDGKG